MSGAWGFGLATVRPGTGGAGDAGGAGERYLDVLYLAFGLPGEDDPPEEVRALLPAAGHAHPEHVVVSGVPLQGSADPARAVVVRPTATVIDDLAAPPATVPDAYLRLHLLSGRRVRPNELSVDGIFSVLPNVAWTDAGPCDPADLDRLRALRRDEGRHLVVHGLDKFPRLLDYVAPSGVRIADAGRVRLGAHLAEGTTVMHEGFVNFNAGTLGPCMVEGRISQGVTVGAHSDVGGGASIMGTLSGGGKERVSVGEHCLLGANSGLGIALGDECTVEAGLYLTAGTLVRLPDDRVVKARELSGASGLLFRRHSQTGAVEAVPRSAAWSGLNPALHAP